MQDIQSVIRAASRRLYISDSFRTLAVTTSIGAGGLIVARIAEKTFGFAIPWQTTILAAAAGAVVSAAAWSFLRRKRALGVAREIDERADLKESLSTALCVEASTDPWARMVVETAQERAKTVKVGEIIPISAPRFWPVPIAAAAAFALVYFNFPTIDLTGRIAQQEEEVRREREIVEVKADVEKRREELQQALAKAKVELDRGDGSESESGTAAEMQDADAIRRALVKELTTADDKLSKLRDGEKAMELENLKDTLRQLRQPGNGALEEFSRQLARANFTKAKDALNQISRDLNESMSEQEREELQRQLENLAKQLENLSDKQEQVAKQLQKQGLDKKTAEELAKKAATDPQALKDALEQMQNLTPEQQQQLMKMAKSAMEAAGQCQSMSEAMNQMAQGMTQDGLQQEGVDGMESLQGELSAAEMLQSDMEALDAALDEVKEQMASLAGEMGNCSGKGEQGDGQGEGEGLGGGLGPWAEGGERDFASGSGGAGRGTGASPEALPSDYEIENKKAKVQTSPGPIIGTRLVYGEQIRGESRAQFEDGVEAGVSSAKEAMESMTVPREYHDAVKHYFGRLQSKVNKTSAPAPAESGSGEQK